MEPNQQYPVYPLPVYSTPKSFWRTGSGVALIVCITIGTIMLLCMLGCLGLGVIGAAHPQPTPSF